MKKSPSLREFLSKKMLILFLLGFSSGLPFLLVGGTLKLWLAREKVDVSTIGYFSWVGMAYSLKFIWAPLQDRFSFFGFGRRRSWMLLTQVLLAVGIFFLGTLQPTESLSLMAAVCVVIAFLSSTQDIAVDAYRREVCTDEELGIGATIGIYGFRVAMLIAGGVGIGFVGTEAWNVTWGQLYAIMAALMGVGLATTLWAPEPAVNPAQRPHSLFEAVVDPVREFVSRDGAIFVLLFIFLFKLGDALGAAMLSPFYVAMGYSNADIALIAKTVGLTASLVGLLLGGILMLRLGIYRSLLFFGILQTMAAAGFALITWTGPTRWALALTVVFEDVSQGMGNAAFVAFIASVCNRRYTATQYAALSSLAALGRNFFSGFTGEMVKQLGWAPFFITCGFIGIPGLILVVVLQKREASLAVPN